MKSIRSIQKITKAMKMVAASKLRGFQVKVEASRGIPLPFVSLLGDTPGMHLPDNLSFDVSVPSHFVMVVLVVPPSRQLKDKLDHLSSTSFPSFRYGCHKTNTCLHLKRPGSLWGYQLDVCQSFQGTFENGSWYYSFAGI